MAAREGARQTGMAMVVAVLPDVCLTPMGATPVPVPYPIVGWFSNCAIVAQTVRMCGRPTFTTASNVTNVVGDEAGTAGGVKSGVNKSICESVTASSTVKAEGNRVLRHGDQMKMNNGNTIGTLIYMPGLGPMIVGAPSDKDMVDAPWGRMRKSSNGFEFLGKVGSELIDIGKGMGQSGARQWQLLGRFAKGDFSGATKDFFKDTLHKVNAYDQLKPWYDAATSDDPDKLGAMVAAQLVFALITDGAADGLAGPEVEAPPAVDADAGETTVWDPEPDAARTTPMEAADPTPSTERPTAQTEAVDEPDAANNAESESTERPTAEMDVGDPDAADTGEMDAGGTGKMAAQDGAFVKGPRPGESPPPKVDGKYADKGVNMTEYGKNFDAENPVQIYNAEELASRRVVAGPDGELIYAKTRRPVGSGEYIYAMDKNGNIYVSKPNPGYVHHSSLAGGESPAAAGHMEVVEGKPTMIDDDTGHYGHKGNQPMDRPDLVKNELQDQGADVSNTRTENVANRPKNGN